MVGHFVRSLSRLLLASTLFILALLAGLPAEASLRWTTRVSDLGQTGNSLWLPNTTRKVAVHPNGTIYVVYHGSNGLRMARSTDNGASFSPSVQISASDLEGEVAVSSTGIVYVAYVSGGTAYVVRSLDQGQTFQAGVAAGNVFSPQVHMATDGQYVYLFDQPGNNFKRSSDNGLTFTGVSIGAVPEAYSDVLVDPANHQVILQVDNPDVKYYVSSDYGLSFTPQIHPNPGGNVYYSVGTLSSGSGGRFLLAAGGTNGPGSGLQVVKTNLASNPGPSTIPAWPQADTTNGRSLAADIYGNVVTGYTSGGNVAFAVSTDIGETFGPGTTVAAASYSSAGINTTNGDVMFAYEAGGVIYLGVHGNLLDNYELLLSNSNLTFATQTVGTSSSAKTLVVTNQSTGPVTLNGVGIAGDFSQTNLAPVILAAGASFTIDVTFSPTAATTLNGQVTVTYNGTKQRVISLTGTGTLTPNVGTPNIQATNVGFPIYAPSQRSVSWARGNGTNCAVFMSLGTSGQATPSDFVTYTPNTTFGLGSQAGSGWFCVYNGTGTGVTVTGLAALSTYRVHVCEYNGSSGTQAYNGSVNQTNPANGMGGYDNYRERLQGKGNTTRTITNTRPVPLVLDVVNIQSSTEDAIILQVSSSGFSWNALQGPLGNYAFRMTGQWPTASVGSGANTETSATFFCNEKTSIVILPGDSFRGYSLKGASFSISISGHYITK